MGRNTISELKTQTKYTGEINLIEEGGLYDEFFSRVMQGDYGYKILDQTYSIKNKILTVTRHIEVTKK